MNITEKILKSWSYKEGNVHTTKELVNWIQDLNKNTYVSIQEQSILNDTFWFYDDYNGEVLNRKRRFFVMFRVILQITHSFFFIASKIETEAVFWLIALFL